MRICRPRAEEMRAESSAAKGFALLTQAPEFNPQNLCKKLRTGPARQLMPTSRTKQSWISCTRVVERERQMSSDINAERQ